MSRWLAVVLALCTSCAMAGLASERDDGSPPDAATDSGSNGNGSGSNGHGSDGSGSGMATGNCADAITGVLATWDFGGETGEETSVPASMTASGASAGDVQRSADLVGTSTGSNSINASGWPLSATLDASVGYYTVAITPPSGCTMSLTGASVQGKASATGPESAKIGTSDDGFSQTAAVSISTSDVMSSPGLSVDHAAGQVEIRIFGLSATSANGTMRLDGTLSISGSFQ